MKRNARQIGPYPGKLLKGGWREDLVAGAKRVFIAMEHAPADNKPQNRKKAPTAHGCRSCDHIVRNSLTTIHSPRPVLRIGPDAPPEPVQFLTEPTLTTTTRPRNHAGLEFCETTKSKAIRQKAAVPRPKIRAHFFSGGKQNETEAALVGCRRIRMALLPRRDRKACFSLDSAPFIAGKRIFAALPLRDCGPEASSFLKFDPMPPAPLARAESEARLHGNSPGKGGSRTLRSITDLHDAWSGSTVYESERDKNRDDAKGDRLLSRWGVTGRGEVTFPKTPILIVAPLPACGRWSRTG